MTLFGRRLAAAPVVPLAGACGEGGGPAARTAAAAADGRPAADVPDTALLAPEAVRIAGFVTDTARRVAWRAAWATPARLVLDPTGTQPLGTLVEGRVLRVLVLPGDRVRRGQVLVTLHSEEMLTARSALRQAEAGRVQAESGVRVAGAAAARAERLYAARAGSLAELERARGALADAEAGRRRAAAELTRAREFHAHLVGEGPPPPRDRAGYAPDGHDDGLDVLVRAPFDGVVVARDVQPGAVVHVGAPMVTVSRLGALALSLRLPEQALGAARPGAEVRFTVPAHPGRAFAARVTRVSPALDSLSRTAEVVAAVPNADGALRAEMTAAAELLGPPGAGVVAVPDAAVQEFDGDTVVVTARPAPGAGGRLTGVVLEAVRVRAGRRSGGLVEIRAGLAPGAAVVTEGAGIAKAEVQRRREARGGGDGGEGGA